MLGDDVPAGRDRKEGGTVRPFSSVGEALVDGGQQPCGRLPQSLKRVLLKRWAKETALRSRTPGGKGHQLSLAPHTHRRWCVTIPLVLSPTFRVGRHDASSRRRARKRLFPDFPTLGRSSSSVFGSVPLLPPAGTRKSRRGVECKSLTAVRQPKITERSPFSQDLL